MTPRLRIAVDKALIRRLRRTARMLSLGFGSGLSPAAPGTADTLFAWMTCSRPVVPA